jgi:hypothetical protein
MKRFLIVVLIVLNLAACKEVFEAPPKALLLASFYHSVTKKSIEPEVTLVGVGVDSVLFDQEKASGILLPLAETDTSRFIIWLDSKSDSISLFYKSTLKYESMESGFYYEYKLKSVIFTQNRIDSIEIKDSLVTTKWHENIKLYIRPLPAGSN